ncbi:MAG: hypothetical protein GY856_01885 [bacterium]|nr:hypothetical protein [bacterium]
MIRIERGPEPEGLASIRQTEIERVRQIPNPSQKDVGRKYRSFASRLRTVQRYKCCYCEMRVQQSHNDVEHYRPKARADRSPGSAATHGYWWLAWTWENLLFACPGCNRSAKNVSFPLAVGSVALAPEEMPPGQERPLLIDPAAENGIDRIRFRPNIPGKEGEWLPAARDDDARGEKTVRVLELARDDLLDLYRVHVERLMPIVHDVRGAIDRDDSEAVQEEWRRAVRELRPRNEFVGLTHDVLDHFFPENERSRWGLRLRRP